eukprot:CAMPEP_0114259038 /NCGR_PEP_ID=MMETSP0058-20121206/19665_1 /TAXON_ID=36894 /ORGANISM="Pyramimonas parkeae, CCMP726" /LENGTH=518 /DNA_ID=CAMNT_0001374029 /DNA_START=233 /DNA_END=1789 /DNA_ORIENTATION=-
MEDPAPSGLGENRDGELPRSPKSTRPITLLPLVALIFYEVSGGGPFGIEESVSSGGPLFAILGFVVLPLVWAVPEALIAAELGTSFPENSGFVAWVTAAFGPFWGFQEGLWSWLSGVTDNAIYPVLFLSYLEQAMPVIKEPQYHWVILFGMVAVLTYFNYRGLSLVGRAVVVLTAFTLLPFVVFCVLAAPQVDTRKWLEGDWESVKWGPYLNCIFWNINYWDSASTLVGEISDPNKHYPRAVLITLAIVMLSYIAPLIMGIGLDSDRSRWKEGYLEHLAFRVGGPVLGWWVVAAAAISNIGQFEAEMSSDAYLLQGMAERGMLPARLARKSKYGSPPLALLLSCSGMVLAVFSTFTEVVELLNFLYCLAELLEFAAFVRLRIIAPDLNRPFRIPLGTAGIVAILLFPVAFIIVIMCMASLRTIVVSGTVVVCGPVLYYLAEMARRNKWCEFYEMKYYVAYDENSHQHPTGGVDTEEEYYVPGALESAPEENLNPSTPLDADANTPLLVHDNTDAETSR